MMSHSVPDVIPFCFIDDAHEWKVLKSSMGTSPPLRLMRAAWKKGRLCRRTCICKLLEGLHHEFADRPCAHSVRYIT